MTQLKPDPRNARKHSERNKKAIKESLDAVGAGRSILADADGIIRAGNGVFEQWGDKPVKIVETDGKELVVVQRTDLRGKDAIRAAALDNIAADSSAHDYDAAILAEIANDDEIVKRLANEDAKLAALIGAKAWDVKPEDVYSDPNGDGMETKAGYRLSSIWYGMTRENEVRPYMLDLPPRPNVHDGATVKLKYSRTNAEETERIVKTYMRTGDRFFEMCCGWMTFSSTAKYFGYSGKGGDIWDVSLEFCKQQIEKIPGDAVVEVVYADCRDTKEPLNTYDFVHSNPPFFNLEPYGESDSDLASASSYELWLDAMGDMGREAERILKPGGLANFVINDFRDDGAIVPMHSDFIASILKKSGLVLHDLVVAEVISQALRFRKHDYERRRTVKCHEYVITFRKKAVAEMV